MKALSPALQAHLDEGTTTLSWCWRIARTDGVMLGFTDHDAVLTFDGTDFEPESGFAASEVRSGSDLAVDAQDAEGVLTSDRITETDISDGRWGKADEGGRPVDGRPAERAGRALAGQLGRHQPAGVDATWCGGSNPARPHGFRG